MRAASRTQIVGGKYVTSPSTTLETLYRLHVEDPANSKSHDICEHLSTLREYASRCESVVEMGVRWGSSTVALASACPKKMTSYDLVQTPELSRILETIRGEPFDYRFIIGDTLAIEIDEVDLLFIDTLHTYNQLRTEMKLHAGKTRKYILLHDTASFGRVDEDMYGRASHRVKEMKKTKAGIRTAMEDFLEANGEWSIELDVANNNGLTVLVRRQVVAER